MVPKELYEEIKKGDCVLFAGAGISTEGGTDGQPSFYENILSKCKSVKKDNLSFPDLMQKYCDEHDGGRKNRLIREIIERIELFSEQGKIYDSATIFHDYIAKIPQFKIIVTTNWDTFFEKKLNVLVPLVDDLDLPFWDDKKRQILKIHGSVTSPHTIVSTQNDYKKLIRNLSKKPIFNKLKDLMATKTFLFVGYSMSDKNIQAIYDSLLKKLGNFVRTSYAIDPNSEKKVMDAWGKRGVKIINGSPISFMKELTTKLIDDKIIQQ
ncbi:SIR2 family protein [Candidatus Pacearchaeota archaeon]|nr:SIR2 family protein [Candidatus Pacearchaeota archaeon]